MVRFCKSSKSLVGKIVIITGSNSGIGYATAIELAKRGGRIIMACRNLTKANEARDKIISATNNQNVIVKQIDLSSLSSVREFAQDIIDTEDRLDILINNAGAIKSPNQLTEDDLRLEMATNYFGHFLLTILLLDLLKKSAPSRVLNVSSSAAKMHCSLKIDELNKHKGSWNMYSKSKLCQIYFTQEFAKRLEGTGVTAYSLHPGGVATDTAIDLFSSSKAFKWIGSKLFLTIEEGAQTSIYLALEDGVEVHNGQHFEDCKRVKPYSNAKNEEKRRRLWEMSEQMVGLTQQ